MHNTSETIKLSTFCTRSIYSEKAQIMYKPERPKRILNGWNMRIKRVKEAKKVWDSHQCAVRKELRSISFGNYDYGDCSLKLTFTIGDIQINSRGDSSESVNANFWSQ